MLPSVEILASEDGYLEIVEHEKSKDELGLRRRGDKLVDCLTEAGEHCSFHALSNIIYQI